VRLRAALSRRPSAPMVVSLVALFMSVGGVGYAAISLPANSVGTAQLQNHAVTYKKIMPNTVGAVRLANNGVTNSKIRNGAVSYQKIQPRAVGRVRANLDQLQARLTSTCAAGTAIGGVDSSGKVTCNAALPAQIGAADKTAAVGATLAAVNAVALPAGASYLVFANPGISVTSGGSAQQVTVTCTLAFVGNAQSRSVTIDTGTSGTTTASIPLQLAGPAGAYSVACSASVNTGALPAVTATTAINALQTAS
jgi:hypothetical protein